MSLPKSSFYGIGLQSCVFPFTPSLKSFVYSGPETIRHYYKKCAFLHIFFSKTTLKLCGIDDLHRGFLSKVECGSPGIFLLISINLGMIPEVLEGYVWKYTYNNRFSVKIPQNTWPLWVPNTLFIHFSYLTWCSVHFCIALITLTSPNALIGMYNKNRPFLAFFSGKCPKMTLFGNILSLKL